MGALQILESVRDIEQRISSLREEKTRLRALATDTSAKPLDGMPYSNTGTVSQKLQDAAVKLVMLEHDIETEILRYISYRNRAMELIRKLNDTEYGALHRYYILGMTWERTAEDMHYSTTQLWRIKNAAIDTLDEIIKNEGEN